MSDQVFLHSCQHLTLSPFFNWATLTVMWWYLIVDFSCISLRPNKVEHLFMCLYATCISLSVKYLCIFCPFSNEFFFFFYCLSFESSSYILYMWFTNIFFPVCSLSFNCLHRAFRSKSLILMRYNLPIFPFIDCP